MAHPFVFMLMDICDANPDLGILVAIRQDKNLSDETKAQLIDFATRCCVSAREERDAELKGSVDIHSESLP